LSGTVEIVKKVAGELREPRLTIYVALLERRLGHVGPGISREQLLELTGLSTRILEQSLDWLEQHGLVSELQAVSERWFFAEY
jgi:DNA-binding HxlR family transcriptional regulator